MSGVMKLDPQQAPLYGECILTVRQFKDEPDAHFYLLFNGSTLRHLTSVRRSSHATLEAVCPPHNCCESVQVTLHMVRLGHSLTCVAQADFSFTPDLASDTVQVQVNSANQEGAPLLPEHCVQLHDSLVPAPHHMDLPQISHRDSGAEAAPQETAVQSDLVLRQPGDCEASGLVDGQAAPLLLLADTRGLGRLQHLLARAETAGPDLEVCSVTRPTDRVLWYHPRLNTYTLTAAADPGDPPPDLQEDVDQLELMINQGGPLFQTQSELVSTTHEYVKSLGVAAPDSSSCTAEKSIPGDSTDGNGERNQEGRNAEGSSESQPLSTNGGSEVQACPYENSSVACDAQEEKDVGVAPVLFRESRNESEDSSRSAPGLEEGPDLAFSEPSWRSRQEETDTGLTAISLSQDSLGGADVSNQEVVSTEERAGETSVHDNEKSDLGESTIVTDMGHSQSQETLGPPQEELEKLSHSTVQIGENMKETTTSKELQEDLPPEREEEIESNKVVAADLATRDLSDFSPSHRGGRESEGAVVEAEQLSPQAVSNAESESVASCCEQSQEAAAVDYVEADGGDGSEVNNKQPVDSVWNGCKEPDLIEMEEPGKSLPDMIAERQENEKEEDGAFYESDLETPCSDSQPLQASILKVESPEADSGADLDHSDCKISTPDPASEIGDVLSKVNDSSENDVCSPVVIESVIGTSENKGSIVMVDLNQDSSQQLHITKEDTLGTNGVTDVMNGQLDMENEVGTTQEVGPGETVEVSGIVPLVSVPTSYEEEALNSVIGSTVGQKGRSEISSEVISMQECCAEEVIEVEGGLCAVNGVDVKLDAEASPSSGVVDEFPPIGDEVQGRNLLNEVMSMEEVVPQEVMELSKPLEKDETVINVNSESLPEQDTGQALLVTETDLGPLSNENSPESSPEQADTDPTDDHSDTDIGGQREQEAFEKSEQKLETLEFALESDDTGNRLPTSADKHMTEIAGEGLAHLKNDQVDVHEESASEKLVGSISVPDRNPLVSEITSHSEICVNGKDSDMHGLDAGQESSTGDTADGMVELLTSNTVSEKVSDRTDSESVTGEAMSLHVNDSIPDERVAPTEPLEQTNELPGPDSLGLNRVLGIPSHLDRDGSLSAETEHAEPAETVEKASDDKPKNVLDSETTGSEVNGDAPTTGADTPAAEDMMSSQKDLSPNTRTDHTDTAGIQREKDAFYSVSSCLEANALERKQSAASPESLESFTPPSVGSSLSTPQRDSGSDVDGLSCANPRDDSMFQKGEGTGTGGSNSEAWASCSSTDDTASTGTAGSTQEHYAGDVSWGTEKGQPPGDNGGRTGTVGGTEVEEEAKDRLTEVPDRTAILRSSVRSLSPFRRHSWGPGKNSAGEAELSPRSSFPSLEERRPSFHKRSMSWCPSEGPGPDMDEIGTRSYSLEGLSADRDAGKSPLPQATPPGDPQASSQLDSEDRGSLVSLTEEEQESYLGDCSSLDSQNSTGLRPMMQSCSSMTLPLTKSVSLLAISQKDLDMTGHPLTKRRVIFSFSVSPVLPKSKTLFSIGSSSSDEEEPESMRSTSKTLTLDSLSNSISEEDPGPLRNYTEGKSGTKVSRTFSYIRSKMYRKSKEKDKDKSKDKDKDAKEKEKKALNGHLFSTANAPFTQCHQCSKPISTKEAAFCSNCTAHVHKGCRESLPACAKVKMKLQKQQCTVPDSASTGFNPVQGVTMRQKTTPLRERPRSAVLVPEDANMALSLRRPVSIMPFHTSNLSKSVSISNIPSPILDDMPLKDLRYLSQSTDSLHKSSKVNESTESLADDGMEMTDSQLLGEFEADAKELEADSWSFTVDNKYLKQLKKDVIKRQDVIYELVQTEMHHIRTLRIMTDVYGKGLLKEVQLETQVVEKLFPATEELLALHSLLLSRLLWRKRQSQQEGRDGGFVIHRLGDILVDQFSGTNAERMKKVYGKFCSRHNEGVNFYKELLAKDKRFQAFIKKKMSSSIVRRLGIPECILLVTQRITKYPVLLQRILQHTKESEDDHKDVEEALRLVKEVIAAVDSKVHEHEQKRRLREVHGRMDARSITRMKSGQMFAREDLVRGRRLLRDGSLQLKTSTGRLKDVHTLLLSDVLVFLQEKDQKYIFAQLDQRSTVISLQKLIVREVANEERAFFVITAGIQKPEMVEVHAISKDERNSWMHFIQEAMHSVEKDEDESVPSETEEDRRHQEIKAKEMRDLLQKMDEQIIALLEEKVKLFRDMCEGASLDESPTRSAAMFRTNTDDMLRGDPIVKDALKEVERLQSLVNGGLSGGMVCLPRRAETFGGFDIHQMTAKNGAKDESVDSVDLRRTESDSVLKKGGDTSLALVLKKNSEVLHSVTRLHDLLSMLQAVVVQQDSLIEDQRQALSERPPITRAPTRPSSLLEQEKQRSLEKQRQEAAELQRQQAAHAEERRRRERQWETRERELVEREAGLRAQEEEAQRQEQELNQSRQELLDRKEEYQRDLERLRDAQRKLERERAELERVEQERKKARTSSSTSEDSLKLLDTENCELSSSPGKDSLMRMGSKRKGRSLNPFALNSSHKPPAAEAQTQLTSRLLQLAKTKDKKDKKKKKVKGQLSQPGEPVLPPEPHGDGEIFFC